MATTPITRFIEKVEDDGKRLKAYKVYNNSSPH